MRLLQGVESGDVVPLVDDWRSAFYARFTQYATPPIQVSGAHSTPAD
jgi:hypothetical protein